MTLQTDDPRYALLNTFMYARPRRHGIRPSATFGVLVLLSVSLLLLPFIVGSDREPATNVSAAEGPTRVQGHVYDSMGSAVYGAQVDVLFLTSKSSWSGSTDVDGYYVSRVFSSTEWNVDETIEVTATYGSDKVVNTSLAVDWIVQVVNVTLSLVIPEFDDSLGFLLVLGFSMSLVVAASRRMKLISG